MRLNPLGLKWQRFVLAVNAEGEMVGCGQVKPHRGGSRELASIAVYKLWRRQGIARAIITHLQAEHDPPLWLTCASPRVSIYQKFGFREVTNAGEMPFYFGLSYRLFKLLAPFFFRGGHYLAVMVWPGGQ